MIVLAPLLAAGCGAVGVAPRFDMLVGPSLLVIGDNYAGLDSNPPAGVPVLWGTMFDRGTGLDLQWVLRRPSQAGRAFAKSHTFLVARGTRESYRAKIFTLFAGPYVLDDLEILGTWLEGRTVLGTVDGAWYLRPYLQYGVGAMHYSEVGADGPPHWDATVALGGRLAAGLEFRKGGLGFYAEGGIQTVGAPHVADVYYGPMYTTADVVVRTAQGLVTYPVRLGIVMGF